MVRERDVTSLVNVLENDPWTWRDLPGECSRKWSMDMTWPPLWMFLKMAHGRGMYLQLAAMRCTSDGWRTRTLRTPSTGTCSRRVPPVATTGSLFRRTVLSSISRWTPRFENWSVKCSPHPRPPHHQRQRCRHLHHDRIINHHQIELAGYCWGFLSGFPWEYFYESRLSLSVSINDY